MLDLGCFGVSIDCLIAFLGLQISNLCVFFSIFFLFLVSAFYSIRSAFDGSDELNFCVLIGLLKSGRVSAKRFQVCKP